MLRAWRKCFDQVEDKPATDHDESELVKLLGQATFETSITQIGLSNTALEALDTKNMLTVKDLLAYKPGRLKRMSGIVGDVRREIIKVADILRDRLGIPTGAATTQHEAPDTEIDEQAAASASVDRLCAKVRRGNPKNGDETEQKFLESLLGLRGSGQRSAVSDKQQKLNAESASELTADRSSTWPSRSQLSMELSI